MRERKYIKLRTDMYEDTKFKIIDTKPQRDTIHYVWTRFVTLAGKVNMEGDLYMSRNLPYTIETLAIEFNRNEEQIKLALEVFIELEMMELIDGMIYRVKNFAKHQNIKVKEKVNSEDKVIVAPKNTEEALKDASTSENYINEIKKAYNEVKKSENNAEEDETADIKKNCKEYQEIIYTRTNEMDNANSEIVDDGLKESIPINIESRKNKKKEGKKKQEQVINVTDEEDVEDNEIISFTEEERPLDEGERVILKMTFDADDFTEECLC